MSAWDRLEALLNEAPGDWSVCVQTPDSRTHYAGAADIPRPAASLIKVPLAMAWLEAARRRQEGSTGLDLEASVTLQEEDRVEGGGWFDAAPAGTTATYRDLLSASIRESDNTASNLLVRAIGMPAVNHFATVAPFQLRVTGIQRRFMDFTAAAAGRDNLTTAREMCVLLSALLHDDLYRPLLEWLRNTRYHDKLAAGVPDGIAVAHKGGDLPGVEHDAGIVYAPTGPYIAALLGVSLPDPASGQATIAAASRLIYDGVNSIAGPR